MCVGVKCGSVPGAMDFAQIWVNHTPKRRPYRCVAGIVAKSIQRCRLIVTYAEQKAAGLAAAHSLKMVGKVREGGGGVGEPTMRKCTVFRR